MFTRFLTMPLAKKSALICALCCLTGCLILSLASYQSQRQLIANSAELLGQNFAQKLAGDASTPLVQGDKISLQSLLNDLVKSPAIVHSAIYDVANKAIAEAGAPHRSSTDRAFSASISFQDSLAGYAVININPELLRGDARSSLWQLLTLGLLLAALAYWVGLAPARYVVAAIDDLTTIAGKPLRPGSSVHIAYRGRDELYRLAGQILTGPKLEEKTLPALAPRDDYALLHFDINNLPTLQQQRSQQSVRRLLDRCHRQLLTLGKLYDGELAIDNSNSFTLTFYPNNEQHYSLRALCSAYLLSQLFSDSGPNKPMQVGIGVLLDHRSQTQDSLSYQLSMRHSVERGRQLSAQANSINPATLVADNSLWQHPSVQQLVVAQALDPHCASIDALQNPYRDLLDQQLATLRSQLS